MQIDYFHDSGAVFSPCNAYRYHLWRRWETGPRVAFIMLNPSTADATRNDPTIERCHRRAIRMGFKALDVVNLFAYRATDPRNLKASADPVGPDNDAVLIETAKSADMVICAWGTHGTHHNRHQAVKSLLRRHDIRPHVLALTKQGLPKHPLYLPYEQEPVAWDEF